MDSAGQQGLARQGWRLVLTGHSLGAGAAALMSLKIRDRYPGLTLIARVTAKQYSTTCQTGVTATDLRCWAFSPPGGLVSRSLLDFMHDWCVSVVVGKDVVPRMTVNNLNRLMDEMVVSLARCRRALFCSGPTPRTST